MEKEVQQVLTELGGGLSPSEGDLRKFLDYKDYLDWLHDTGKTFFYSILYKNLLKYKLGCS